MQGVVRDHKPEAFCLKASTKSSLLEAMGLLASAGSLGEVIEIVRSSARCLIAAQGICFILRDGDACHYAEEDAIGPLWKDRRFPLSDCISGWTMLHRQRVVIPDVMMDSRIPHELYGSTFVRSLLMIPVGSADPMGAIGAYWDHCHEATAEEIEILEAIAGACTTAIENARLLAALSHALSEAELARDELRHRLKNVYASATALAKFFCFPKNMRWEWPGDSRGLRGRTLCPTEEYPGMPAFRCARSWMWNSRRMRRTSATG
jgi:GAF domain-containing protein